MKPINAYLIMQGDELIANLQSVDTPIETQNEELPFEETE